MISFDLGGDRFNYRTAAVVVHDRHVLACRELNGDFWYLPGGRCELMESSYDAVRREVREELGADGTVERLLWIAESFFALDGRRFHEIAFYYLVSLPAGSLLLDKTRLLAFREGTDHAFEMRWFRLADVTAINLVPAFLRTGLSDLPQFPCHIVLDAIGR